MTDENKIPCPVKTCRTTAKSESGLTRHVNSKHGGWAAVGADNGGPAAEPDDDPERGMVWVDGYGLGHCAGRAPDSYSTPHVTVIFMRDGLYHRVPEESVVQVTSELAAQVPTDRLLAWAQGEFDPRTDRVSG